MAELHPSLTNFIERFALMAEEEGHPRIAGRIVGLLVVLAEPLSFDEIAEKLQVSRGSISTNTRLLEQRGIIRRVSRLGERKDLFEISRDVHISMLEGVLRRQRTLRDLAAESRKEFPPSESRARASMKEMEEFFAIVIESTEKLLEKLKKR